MCNYKLLLDTMSDVNIFTIIYMHAYTHTLTHPRMRRKFLRSKYSMNYQALLTESTVLHVPLCGAT